MTKVYIGADHRGFAVKRHLVEQWQEILTTWGLSVDDFGLVDLGADNYQPDDDFNDSAIAVATAVQDGGLGILICGSAHGIAMQANRFRGVRAICGYTAELAKLGRQHNDANILCLSADFMASEVIDEVVGTFLTTAFLAEPRFIRRNQRLDAVLDASKQVKEDV